MQSVLYMLLSMKLLVTASILSAGEFQVDCRNGFTNMFGNAQWWSEDFNKVLTGTEQTRSLEFLWGQCKSQISDVVGGGGKTLTLDCEGLVAPTDDNPTGTVMVEFYPKKLSATNKPTLAWSDMGTGEIYTEVCSEIFFNVTNSTPVISPNLSVSGTMEDEVAQLVNAEFEFGIDCRDTFRSWWGDEDWWNDLLLNKKVNGSSKDTTLPLLYFDACNVDVNEDRIRLTCPDFYDVSEKNPTGSAEISFYPTLPGTKESGMTWSEYGKSGSEVENYSCKKVVMRPLEAPEGQVRDLYCMMTNVQSGVVGQNDVFPALTDNLWYHMKLPSAFIPSRSEDYMERVYEIGPGMTLWYKYEQEVLTGMLYLDIPTPGFSEINTLNWYSGDSTRIQYRCYDRKLDFMELAYN